MKRLSWLFISVFFISIFFVPSANGLFWAKQALKNPYKAKGSSKQEPLLMAAPSSESDPYAQAEALFKEKKYDHVIRLLAGPAHAEPHNFKLNILLAKAQVEKCAILKANGDKSYKILIKEPYVTGRRLHKIDKTHPDLYYIVAKSLLINNRVRKAGKTIKKAIYFSTSAHNKADYLLVLGDVWSLLLDDRRAFSSANAAYKRAIELRKDDKEFRTKVEKRIKKLSEKMKPKEEQDFGE